MPLNVNLREIITYWAPLGTGVFGEDTFDAPKQVNARWEDRQEMIRDKAGQEVISTSRIWLSEDISINGYLFRGETNELDPLQVDGAKEIRQFSKVPDLRYITQTLVAYL